MGNDAPIVYIVDDEPMVLQTLEELFQSVGLRTVVFSSAQEFLRYQLIDAPSCLILDIRLPEISGLDLQEVMNSSGFPIPIIFITGYGDVPTTVRAMKAGAADFLQKPFNHQELLDSVNRAVDRDRRNRILRKMREDILQRISLLTSREREVFTLVTSGMLNKQIAAKLNVSEKTIKVHRARVMEKMQAGSLADLVRMAEKAGMEVQESIKAPIDHSK